MIDGTWLWYNWAAYGVLLVSFAISATRTHHVMLEKGRPVLAALSLVAWIFAGAFAIIVFGRGGF